MSNVDAKNTSSVNILNGLSIEKPRPLRKIACESALNLLEAGARKKTWTSYDREQWIKAFNALQRLAGKKIIWRAGELVKGK